MPEIHCGTCKQTKLSKTMGSPSDTMGEIISSQFPNSMIESLTVHKLSAFAFPFFKICTYLKVKQTHMKKYKTEENVSNPRAQFELK